MFFMVCVHFLVVFQITRLMQMNSLVFNSSYLLILQRSWSLSQWSQPAVLFMLYASLAHFTHCHLFLRLSNVHVRQAETLRSYSRTCLATTLCSDSTQLNAGGASNSFPSPIFTKFPPLMMLKFSRLFCRLADFSAITSACICICVLDCSNYPS